MNTEQKFISLGWEILEHRYRYYMLDAPIIEDYAYDMLEKDYKAMAEALAVPASATDMTDWDRDRPSCILVAEKLAYAGYGGKRK